MSIANNPLKIVDISQINDSTAKDILDAATSQGFLFVEGHGFSAEEVADLFKMSKEFFELPEEYKSKFPIDTTNNGYTNYGGENLDPSSQKKGDPKEAYNFSEIDFTTCETKRPLPDWFTQDPKRAQLVKKMIGDLYKLSNKVLTLLAIGLKIEDTEGTPGSEWFTSRYRPDKASGTTFRFLHYPGQKSLSPEAVIRAGAHTDYGSATLLFQQENQEGLEIYSPVSKKWEAVPYVPPNSEKFPGEAAPIVINIADQLSYWTGGLLKSTIHRVKFPPKVQETGQDRYSIVFFSHPNDETLLEPVPSDMIRSIQGRGANNAEKVVTAKEHLDKRLAATYNWSY
ncbi:hypothetical protein EJF18_10836 [Clavispora lusitaniae]|uniref:Fe2OG dioxygenase domain-containing protein n=2 Tax=Clavispora lusitaniae TaxID=36911 RepID=C4XXY8_CLAL4|nr:uncharacterized protein CLUG_00811 [Clavispora lusitaniae ATCC 42720]KAF5212851.1 hypothetical protein E0198_000358 [Clavispora lusitaniae]EEQ36688.1 hypothetical protein CLUG_00811 [Clavispora lusitaniae ATCC 42720]QFZ25727.1 hypothetical protein EJF14_10836 [Clavispora lusitaniae]QFZ30970.1 hypothetical protein EJF16_10836 [Clavispora lusitaniae]QFZ36638.1 hypothetical protein EJF15_10836 [Clavispora lusitaniae]